MHNQAKHYKAFISYAHHDKVWANKLHRTLEKFQMPKNANTHHEQWPLRPVFLDRTELASGPDLSESIQSCLEKSDALIVICSPAAAASKWVNAEILLFKRLGNTQIFPIIIAGDPSSEVPGQACFPQALRYQLDEHNNISNIPAEPLAADARKNADGSDAILKLIAGLLHVSFDALKLRQQRRKIQQALSVAAVSLSMLILTVYLAVTASIARETAERRRDQAESLINYMLGDLRQRLQPVGRLDVLDGIGEQALSYFSSLNADELTSDAMITRATALRQIGEVRVAQGKIKQGLVAFEQALEILDTASSENEAVKMFERGQINYWIADAYFNDLKLEQAQVYIEKYLAICRELVTLEPDNPNFQFELLYAESNLGVLAFRANQLSRARDYFNNALAMARIINANDPGQKSVDELINIFSWLGSIESSAGNLSAASTWYQKQLDLIKTGSVSQQTPEQKRVLAIALWKQAEVYQQAGQTVSAIAQLQQSVQLYRELVAYDPQNYDWHEELAWALVLLARDTYMSESLSAQQARATLKQASLSLSRINDQNTAEVARVAAAITIEQAYIELIEGEAEQATTSIQQAIQQLTPYLSTSDRIRLVPLYARAAYIFSEAQLALGQQQAAVEYAKSALNTLQITTNDPIETLAYAALLAFQCRHDQAENYLAQVANTQYRAHIYVADTQAAQWWSQQMESSSIPKTTKESTY